MNRRIIFPLLVLTLLACLIFGSRYVSSYICGGGTSGAGVLGFGGNSGNEIKQVIGGWQVEDGNDFTSKSNLHFSFENSAYKHNLPLSKSLQNHCSSVVSYLKSNPQKQLNITGFYHDQESNKSSFSDLGLARANDIMTMMAKQGIGQEQLKLSSELSSEQVHNESKLIRGIDFSFIDLSLSQTVLQDDNEFTTKGSEESTLQINTNEEVISDNSEDNIQTDNRIENIKNRLIGNPILLYFGTTESYLNLNDEIKRDIEDMKHYISKVPGSILEINGHTDSKGKDEFNITLSQERAQFVKNIFVKDYGFTMNKLVTSGYGESQPITKNRTSAERAKNRRVELILR